MRKRSAASVRVGLVRSLARAVGLATALGLASCSVVLDWDGYTGGSTEDAADDGDAADAAAPTCNEMTCGGCCDSKGFCAGGQSLATCGSHGQLCQDCGQESLVCNAGACGQPVPDASPPPACNPVTCKQLFSCLTQIQTSCCKADGTCGCEKIALVVAADAGLGGVLDPQGCN